MDASDHASQNIASRPYSHVTQVCTHSYTLVWHDWEQWQYFIDWMAYVHVHGTKQYP